MQSIAATRRGRYGVRGTQNAATVARDQYEVRTRGIASQNANNGGERNFPFETSMDGFLRSSCTSTEQECILLQSDVEVNDNNVQPEIEMYDSNDATTQQAASREEFVRLTKMRQRQGTTAWAAEKNKQFDRGRSLWYLTFLKR